MLLKNEYFGKYELLEKLASGGMADIYLARYITIDGSSKFVAIKRILPHLSKDQAFVNMFKEEAKLAINLNHNNIVSILDFGYENDQYFLVMDYVEGYTLKQICNEFKKENKSLSVDQILYLVKEAAAGLDYAHHCTDAKTAAPLNLIHRDMSPQNIMLSFQGSVKIIDFGIAQAGSDELKDDPGTLKGKFRYMSPEQAESVDLDMRSDLFSLGVILWELLANDHLFSGKNGFNILQKVKQCQIRPISEVNPAIPEDIERIVTKALSKDRNKRYQTAAELSRDLNRLLNQKYPEFSQQAFSVFIKISFSKSYKTNRDKLIQYAQLPYEKNKELIVFDPLEISDTANSRTTEEPEGFGLDLKQVPASNKEMNFEVLLKENLVPESVKSLNIEKDYYATSKQHNMAVKPSAWVPPATSTNSDFAESFAKFAILILIACLGYISINKFVLPKFKGLARLMEVRETKKIEQSSLVDTKPEDSAILPTTYSEKLKNIKVAFINITIAEENPNIKIAINGKSILDKPPIFMYPIVADKETVVTAFDPATKKQAEIKLTVATGKSMDVPLILKPAGN